MEVLQQMGCRVGLPRYPLLHQQPFFTEGHWRVVGRYPEGTAEQGVVSLSRTEHANGSLIRLPNFCHPESGPLIGQYAEAFERAMELL
jgi:hypothetical protein